MEYCICFNEYPQPGDNTEKYGRIGFFEKQNTDVPKARKMAAGSWGVL